jgi:hypothetical protein
LSGTCRAKPKKYLTILRDIANLVFRYVKGMNEEYSFEEEQMKAYFKWGLTGYSGTCDKAIYYYHPRLKLCLMRPYRYPDNKVNTDRTINIMANLKLIQPSEGYKRNFSDYVLFYNECKEYQYKPMLSWNNVYLKMMFALQKAMPEQVDLKTISREQIYAQNLPCKTLKAAIDFGLLPAMPDYEWWENSI